MGKKDPRAPRDDDTAEHLATPASSKAILPSLQESGAPIGSLDSDLSTGAFTDAPPTSSDAGTEVPSISLKPGDRIGENERFEISGRLGAGGMGLVFAANDQQLERLVAIKFILPGPRMPLDRLVDLLRREARAMAQLRHENIVAIFDIATWKGVPYLVMEHLEGESLEQMLARERLTLLRATEIMIDVARGLSHAHGNGIIHRDLKPSNVFVLEAGTAKILDFGLAAFARSPSRPPASGTKRASPLIAGTPISMAPEQWRGGSQDERTDIWAAGVMLFQLFTGERPYHPRARPKLYAEICSERPAPSVLSVREDLPEEAETIVARAMQKNPDGRFQTAAELLEALLGFHDFLTRSPEARKEARRTSQRRQLTVLSCGLTNLATLAEDPDEPGESLSRFTALCTDVVNALSGRLVAVLGGRVVACFGYPVAREGDAQRAVRAGLQIVDAVRRAGPQLGAARPSVRVGIHTGIVIVEDVEGEPGAFQIQGATPEIAASLENRAPGDAVVIGHPTHQLDRGVFDVERLGPVVVDGASQSIKAYRVLRERNLGSRFDLAFASRLTPLVGREDAVERLLGLWHLARKSQGHLALLTGEAGIGKSRLVAVLKDRVGDDGGTRISCQCWPQFKSSAFHPIIELLLTSMQIDREDSGEQKLLKLESSLSTLGMELAEAVPLLTSLLSIPLPGTSTVFLDPRERKKKTIDILTAMLLAMAAQRPVLFVAEDLHWADHSTLELVGALLDLMGAARILVLATSRQEFHPPWPNSLQFSQMPIARLPPRLAAMMVERTAGERKLPAEVVEALVAKTDGIPLFVEEMTRMVVASLRKLPEGGPPGGSAIAQEIPATLNELFLARLDRLTAAGKQVAQVAAVVGRSFPYALIQRVAGVEEATLHGALLSLSESEVLLSQGQPRQSKYQFKHFLLQEAAYHSLPKKVRREHHLRVAQALTELFPETAEIQPELLAHHYTEAGDSDQALEYWGRAGRRAAERSANIEAISHFARAIDTLASLTEGSDRDRRELSLQLAMGAPLMAVKGYAAPEVEKVYARARELCRGVNEDIQLFPALQGLWQFYMVGGELPTSRELAEQLLGLARRSSDSTLLLLAYRALATSVFLQGEIAACRNLTETGLALYDPREHGSLGFRYGHDPGVAHGLYAAWALWLLGYPDQALGKAVDAVTLAETLSHPVSVAFARCYLALLRNACGEHAAAAADAADAIAISNAHRLALWLSLGTMMEGWAQAGLGKWDEGIARFQEGVAAWQQTGARAGMTFFLVTLAEAYQNAGRPQEGMATLDQAAALVLRNSEHYYEAEVYRVRGELRLALAPGDQAGAEAEFERAVEIARKQEAKSLELRATTSLCSLPRRRSRPQEARQLLGGIYGWFSEGLATADLVNARAALERLG